MPTVDEMVAAIQAKDLSAAEKLLGEDPSLAHAKRDGSSMLMLAAYQHAKPIVELLLLRGARPNLWEAAAVGRLDRARELVNANAAGINGWSHDGWTPLHLAAFFGQKEVTAYLLSKGAAIDARSRNDLHNTPLHAACAGGQRTCVALLLQHGARADETYLNGATALHVAAQNGDDGTTRLLLNAKADPSKRTTDGKTALDMAREKGHEKVARLLEQAASRD